MWNEHTMWYAARSAGIISWLLLSLSIIWGLLMSTKIVRGGANRGWVLGVHRSLGGFSVTFTIIHVLALVGDNYTRFDLLDILVPFASEWKPWAVAWGVVGFWMILAVEISSLLKKQLPNNLWKYIHISSLGLFLIAAIHGYTAGSDAHLIFFILAIAMVSSPIGMLTIIRFTKVSDPPANERTAGLREKISRASANRDSAQRSDQVQISSETGVLTTAENSTSEPAKNPETVSEIQSTQWVHTNASNDQNAAQEKNEELPPIVPLPTMAHQKITKRHRGISSLFDEFEPTDKPES